MTVQYKSVEKIQEDYRKEQAVKEAKLRNKPAPRSFLVGDLGILCFTHLSSIGHLDLSDDYSAQQAQDQHESLFDPKQKWIWEQLYADDMAPTGFGNFTVNLTLTLNETLIPEDYMECITFDVDLGPDGKGSYNYFLFMECLRQGRKVKLDKLKMPGKDAIVRFCKEIRKTFGPEGNTIWVWYERDRSEKATIRIEGTIDKQPSDPYGWLREVAERITSYL